MAYHKWVEQHIYWIIGRGDIEIYLNKWLASDIPIMNERVPIKSLFINVKEINNAFAKSLLVSSICDIIKQENITLTHSEDKLCWTKSSSVVFFIKSAWDTV